MDVIVIVLGATEKRQASSSVCVCLIKLTLKNSEVLLIKMYKDTWAELKLGVDGSIK